MQSKVAKLALSVWESREKRKFQKYPGSSDFINFLGVCCSLFLFVFIKVSFINLFGRYLFLCIGVVYPGNKHAEACCDL